MRLEDEIKQEEFKSEYQKLLVNILFTSSWASSKQKRIFKKFDTSPQQYNVLRILRGRSPKPATITLIAERMIDKSSNASRLVDKLLDKKLIVRTVSKIDRRQKEVLISEKGLELLASMDDKIKRFEKQFESLSVNEARQLNNLLDKLRG